MQVFFDINSDGQPLGRVTVELFEDVPVGSLRFLELAEGREGISYQFNEVGPVRLILQLAVKDMQGFCIPALDVCRMCSNTVWDGEARICRCHAPGWFGVAHYVTITPATVKI